MAFANESGNVSPLTENLTLEPDYLDSSDTCDYCICGIPSTENLLACNGPNCPVGFYHRQCVGLPSESTDAAELEEPIVTGRCSGAGNSGGATTAPGEGWLCEFCEAYDECSAANANKPVTEFETSPCHETSQPSEPQSTPGISKSTPTLKKPKGKFKALAISKDDLLAQAPIIMEEAVHDLMYDPLYSDTSLGKEVIALAKEVHSAIGVLASQTIVQKLFHIISSATGKQIGPIAHTHIFREFHRYRQSAGCDEDFAHIIGPNKEYSSTCQSFFQQYILRAVLQKLIRRSQHEKPIEEHVPLNVHDEQVLRYIAGYVPFALLKRYRKVKGAKQIVQFLKQWEGHDEDTSADSFLEYTSVWLTLQNRGGLFVVSDKVYSLFRSLEIVTRKLLKVEALEDRQETLKDKIAKNIYGSVHVMNMWTSVTCDLPSQEAGALFETIVNYWIKLRVNAYVRSYVTMVQHSKQNAKRGKKALRKELAKNLKK